MYKIHIPKSLIPIIILAVTLNILRVVLWGKLSFIFIMWNIFLAFVPYFISSLLLAYSKEEKRNKFIFILGFILWILFIPNAPYIITDFIHLGVTKSVPLIFDTLLLFSSAIIGLILFFHSLFHIEEIIKLKYSSKVTSIIMVVIMIFISFGVYLGRFLRFNSWDVFINPTSLVSNVWKIFSDGAMYADASFYTGLLFLFLLMFYWAYKYSNTK